VQDSRRRIVLINAVTASRLVVALGVAALTPWSGRETWAVAASLALVAVIEVSDLVDGYLARLHNSVSPFGKVFDPYADSISRLIVYWSLAVVGRCLAFVPLVMAVRDVTVAYFRMLMMRRGMDVSARYTGKLKAAVQGVCGLLLMAGPLYWGGQGRVCIIAMSCVVAAMTFASMVDYGLAARRAAAGSG
jgi:CDP-diacylglycerol--glycerol-3-phosphate 3-phosphatidyltransferase